jgi:hypothetical protein
MVPTIAIQGSENVLELTPTADCLGYTASVTRRAHDGSVARTAMPPRGEMQDSWTAVRVDGQQLVAYSWSGFEVRFDLDTGAEIIRSFTK